MGEASAVLKVGDQVAVHVDYERRAFVAPNHTMTHVLNYALRKVLLNSKTNGSNPTSDFSILLTCSSYNALHYVHTNLMRYSVFSTIIVLMLPLVCRCANAGLVRAKGKFGGS